ncbi:response regulator transcription factor [Halalkalibacter alkalisediminis]|uniref:Response regulator transcription factor n=1 Tax=Halalkalibacter alkalisediminis TaxID=935616 RepID=A0ABV6NQD1_9BACI
MKGILIVDDEIQMQKLLMLCLQSEEFAVEAVSSGEEALHILKEKKYDLILLDIMMAGIDGFEVLKRLRYCSIKVPVIILTALGETEEVVRGLNLGADDYVTKPFEPSELIARIHSLLRRSNHSNTEKAITNMYGITLEQNSRQFSFRDEKIDFTKKEYQIFLRLFSNPEQVYTREQLLELEWTGLEERYDRNIDTHIKNIREKLREAGINVPLIETVWGVGYKLSYPEVK